MMISLSLDQPWGLHFNGDSWVCHVMGLLPGYAMSDVYESVHVACSWQTNIYIKGVASQILCVQECGSHVRASERAAIF